MVVFPNCKINLGLRVVGKRNDGYHDLDTVFFPIALRDAAEIITWQKPGDETNGFDLHLSGIPLSGAIENNLCYKAWQLILNDFPTLPLMQMHLLKAIPPGSGLGGGSSDGAFTLKLINEIQRLNIPEEKLLEYALSLGSDCPFFIYNTPCHATGRGEKLEKIQLTLEGYCIFLVLPGININTGWAFQQLTQMHTNVTMSKSTKEIALQAPHSWKNELVNDFEVCVFEAFPVLQEIKTRLYAEGAVYVSMTGTGSTIFGIFKETAPRPTIFDASPFKTYYLNSSL